MARSLHPNQPQDSSTVFLYGLSDPNASHFSHHGLRPKSRTPHFRSAEPGKGQLGPFKGTTNSDPGKPGGNGAVRVPQAGRREPGLGFGGEVGTIGRGGAGRVDLSAP